MKSPQESDSESEQKHKLFGPGRTTPRKEPVFQTQKVYARPFSTVKHRGIPNMDFSEHKLLWLRPDWLSKKFMQKEFLLFFGPKENKGFRDLAVVFATVVVFGYHRSELL